MRDLDSSPDNPFRVPQWRWDRAGDIVESGRKLSRRRDDAWVARGAKFRKALRAASSPDELTLVCELDPPLYWAHQLWAGRGDESRKMHAHGIEARMLALQDHAAIGRRLALSAEVVRVYEHLFFDVRAQAEARCDDYIMFNVLGASVFRGLRMREYDLLWKLYGYFYGEHVLDALLRTVVDPVRPDSPGGVAAAFADDIKGTVRMKAVVAARTLEINGFTAVPLLEHYRSWCDMEREGAAGGDAQAGIINNIQVMMTKLPFTVGRKTTDDPAGIAPYETIGAELRGDELVAIAAGGDRPDFERLETLAFPSPRLASRGAPATAD